MLLRVGRVDVIEFSPIHSTSVLSGGPTKEEEGGTFTVSCINSQKSYTGLLGTTCSKNA